jgi:hypothetical protein
LDWVDAEGEPAKEQPQFAIPMNITVLDIRRIRESVEGRLATL